MLAPAKPNVNATHQYTSQPCKMNRLVWDSRQAILREDEGPETEELRPDIRDAACERVVAEIKVLHGTQTTSCVMDPTCHCNQMHKTKPAIGVATQCGTDCKQCTRQ